MDRLILRRTLSLSATARPPARPAPHILRRALHSSHPTADDPPTPTSTPTPTPADKDSDFARLRARAGRSSIYHPPRAATAAEKEAAVRDAYGTELDGAEGLTPDSARDQRRRARRPAQAGNAGGGRGAEDIVIPVLPGRQVDAVPGGEAGSTTRKPYRDRRRLSHVERAAQTARGAPASGAPASGSRPGVRPPPKARARARPGRKESDEKDVGDDDPITSQMWPVLDPQTASEARVLNEDGTFGELPPVVERLLIDLGLGLPTADREAAESTSEEQDQVKSSGLGEGVDLPEDVLRHRAEIIKANGEKDAVLRELNGDYSAYLLPVEQGALRQKEAAKKAGKTTPSTEQEQFDAALKQALGVLVQNPSIGKDGRDRAFGHLKDLLK